MGLRRERAAGLQQLLELLERLEKEGGAVYVLFCGDRDPQTGDSWCPDCVKGKTILCVQLVIMREARVASVSLALLWFRYVNRRLL